jgi:hypothetical protein
VRADVIAEFMFIPCHLLKSNYRKTLSENKTITCLVTQKTFNCETA